MASAEVPFIENRFRWSNLSGGEEQPAVGLSWDVSSQLKLPSGIFNVQPVLSELPRKLQVVPVVLDSTSAQSPEPPRQGQYKVRYRTHSRQFAPSSPKLLEESSRFC